MATGNQRTRTLPIAGAAGSAGPFRLVASALVAALVAFLVFALATVRAADDLVHGAFAAPDVLLAVHLLVLGFLPLAVCGAALHVLPLMLRGTPSATRGWAALACLCTGPFLAVAVSEHAPGFAWPLAGVLVAGLVLLLAEIVRLVVRAPRNKMLVVSRFGVGAAVFNGLLSLVVGPLLFHLRWRPWADIPHERLIAIHVHLAVLGSLTLLIVAVGRTLGPMLAVAPAARPRRLPVEELLVAAATWLAVAGFAVGSRALLAVATVAAAAGLGPFLAQVVRIYRRRKVPALEGPLVHLLLGGLFAAQGAVLAVLLVAGGVDARLLTAYLVALLVGWAAGVTLGHVGKLIAVSAWTWWPPGPRPRQAAFYPGRLWTVEAVAFAAGTELVVAGTLAGSAGTARAGGVALTIAAACAIAGALATTALRPEDRAA